MDDFIYEYPTKVFLGNGMVKAHLGEVLPVLGDKIMVVYGGGSAKRNGTLNEVLSIIKDSGRSYVEFSGIMPNPTYSKVQEGASLAKNEGITGILALGGGSVIDASKIIALQAPNETDVWSSEMEKNGVLTKSPLPLGAIVTSSGTGSEMNGGAVITNEEKKLKAGLFASAPRFAFLDYHFMETVPDRQVLSGAFDTLSHAMETYFGSSSSLNASDDVALGVMRNTVRNIWRILDDIHDEEARSNLMWDSAMAENGILKVGRFTDFEVHQIEHQLGAYTDCNHGEGLAVIQPVYYHHVYKSAIVKFAEFGRYVFSVDETEDEKVAEKSIEKLEELIEAMGLPRKLTELRMKASPEELLTDDNLKAIADSTNILAHGPRMLSHNEVYEILKECLDEGSCYIRKPEKGWQFRYPYR